MHSAGLVVVEDVPWPVTDLRVDWRRRPVDDLIELWPVWKPQKDDYRVRGIDPTARTVLRGAGGPVTTVELETPIRSAAAGSPAADPAVHDSVRPPGNRLGGSSFVPAGSPAQLSDNGFDVTERFTAASTPRSLRTSAVATCTSRCAPNTTRCPASGMRADTTSSRRSPSGPRSHWRRASTISV